MRNRISVILLGGLASALVSGCASTLDADIAEKTALEWDHKSNTTVTCSPSGGHDPSGGILRMTIDPAEFSYGWVNRPLKEAARIGNTVGLHGYYRSPAGASGTLLCHFIDHSGVSGVPPSYFRSEVGKLEDSEGQWNEFFVPFRDLRFERGPTSHFDVSQLTETDRVQFLASLGNTKVTDIDLAGLEFLDADGSVGIHRRLAQARIARMLLPEEKAGERRHPRLLLTQEKVAELRARHAAHGDGWTAYDRILELADGYVKRIDPEHPFEKVLAYGEDTRYSGHERRGAFEGLLHRAVTPIETIAAAYRLTGNVRYGKHAAATLVTMARQLTVHDPVIDEGFYYTRTFYVRALAFGYDWLQDLMTPEERKVVKATLLGFVLDIHEKSQTGGWGRRPLHRVWNWDPGLMGACGVGMLALEGETRVGEHAIIFDCRRHLRDYLTLGIDADGCCHEGPNYIGYGIGAGVEFIEILRQQGRGDLFTATNYHRIAPWLISETLPDGIRWNNLSDCGHGQAPYPVYAYACGRLAELAKDDPGVPGERIHSPDVLTKPDILWQFSEEPGHRSLSYRALAELMGWAWEKGPGTLDPSGFDGPRALAYALFYRQCPVAEDLAKYLPLGMLFRGRGLAVSRTGFGKDDFHLAVEAGPHVAGHDQCDKGNFTFRAYGADLFIDSGYGNDGDPKKSGSSFAHNVVLIDGEGQPMRYHNQSSGAITGYHHSVLLDWIRVDAREAWGVRYDRDWAPTVTSPVDWAERALLFVRPTTETPGYLVVYDDIQKDRAQHDYTWQWHIPADMELSGDGTVWEVAPRNMAFSVLKAKASGNGIAGFPLRIETSGTYTMYGLTRAGGTVVGKSDSFFISVDDGKKLTWDIASTKVFAWSPVQDRGEMETRIFELTAGMHRICVSQREPDAELSRLIILPSTAPPPVAPDAKIEEAIMLDTAQAIMNENPFERVEAGTVAGPDVRTTVFAVNQDSGSVATSWFETSREGAHPKLEYTVKSVRPRFLVAAVPRRKDTPMPSVRRIQLTNGTGVQIDWGGVQDTVLFTDAPAEAGKSAYGAASFVRSSQKKVLDWMVLDGNSLAVDGKKLCTEPKRGIYASPDK